MVWLFRCGSTKKQNEKPPGHKPYAPFSKNVADGKPRGGFSRQEGLCRPHDIESDVLEQAAKRLESEEDLANQPDVRAELQQIVGACYLNQGQYELAEKYLRIALASETKLYGENSPKLLKTQLALASLSLTKADYASAEIIYARYLPLLRDEYRKGNIEASFLLTALNDYAVLERARGDSKQAEALFRENLCH